MTYPDSGQMPAWLAARAALSPRRLALMAGEQRLTFQELHQCATAAARRLVALGVQPGDRVALLLRNGVDMVTLVHGVGRAGAILVPLNTRLTPAELSWQLQDAGVCLLLYDEANARAADAAISLLTEMVRVVPTTDPLIRPQSARCAMRPVSGLLPRFSARIVGPAEQPQALDDFASHAGSDLPSRERIDLAAVHTIIYTSGTTGRPKGAMLTYGNHWWSAIGSVLNLGLREDDRWLAPLPLFHVGGLSILMRSVIYGIPAIVPGSFDAAAVNRAIDEEGATVVSVVAAILRRMLDERGDRPYPPTLRHVLLGGGPAPLPLLQECLARGVPVVQTYGLTETASQAVTLAPADAARKPGSAGKPLLPMELRIEHAGQSVPSGEMGEIVLRGPSVTAGYIGRPEETARVLRDGWLHTGDLGYLDDEGYLYVLDRRDDLIVSGGENVYPAEIEAALLAHSAVAEAGVTGEDDARWGRVPVAFVVLRPGTEVRAEQLIAFCRERLARYKVPARLYLVDALPRNAAGKLLRRKLSSSVAET